jgi:hypothetical protein
MQKIAIALFLISILAACNSDNHTLPSNCIPVKYVRGICGNAVLQVQNPHYYGVGENADGDDHVFLATLECFSDIDAIKGRLFYVELNPTDFKSDCVVCQAMVNYSGTKQYRVRIHQECGTMEE